MIMPYGGDDSEKRRHFSGVYQSIIVPATAMAGYEAKRSDIAGEPGNITHDIIRDLVEADIVIADLTTANANVFFELGIRHAFRKSGTVHIVDSAYRLPFDVRQYRVVEYSTDLAGIPDTIRLIAEAIKKRRDQPTRPDNPVHDAIPQLPVDIRTTGDRALQERVRTAEEALRDARAQNDVLMERLARIDPGGTKLAEDPDVDVGALLDTADLIMASTGQHALLRLTQAMEDGGPEAFARELRAVLQSPYLDENDFAEINVLCKRARLEGHRRATLEIARHRYPYSEQMFLQFIDALDDSPNSRDQQRGRLMLEQRLGIEFLDGRPSWTSQAPAVPVHQGLMLLFNFYFRAGHNEWVIALVEGLPESLKRDTAILRNKARAFARMNRPDEAQRAYQEAIALDPADDHTILWYADFLDDQGRFAQAYEESENALLADPDDVRLYFHMAIQVFNRGYYRTESGSIDGPLPRRHRASLAVPFVLRGLECEHGRAPEALQEAVRLLVRGGALRVAQAVAAGTQPEGAFRFSALEHVLARANAAPEGSVIVEQAPVPAGKAPGGARGRRRPPHK